MIDDSDGVGVQSIHDGNSNGDGNNDNEEPAKNTVHSKKKKKAITTHCKWCAAINCSNSRGKNPDLTFFRFPADSVQSLKWVYACRRKDLIGKTAEHLWRNVSLCEKHFEANCFRSTKRRLLTACAVPRIFDFRKSPPSLQNSCQIQEQHQPPLASPVPQPPSLPKLEDASHSPLAPSTSTEDSHSTISDKPSPLAPLTLKIETTDETVLPEAPPPEMFDIDCTSETNSVDDNYEGGGNCPEHLYQTSIDDVSNIALEAVGGLSRKPVDTTMEDIEQVLKIHLPFKDMEVMVLVMEYHHLYKRFQRLKELARINVDLLYLTTDMSSVAEGKKEVDKVQELIHTLMNGREVYKIELSIMEENVNTEDCTGLVVEQQNMPGSQGDGHTTKEHENECSTSHDWDFDVEYEAEQMAENDELLQHGEELASAVNKLEEASTSSDLFVTNNNGDGQELACVSEMQEVVSTSSKLIREILNNSSSKERENVEFGKAVSASNPDLLLDNPVGDASIDSTGEQLFRKALKDRIELEKYLESPESQDSSGAPVCKFCDSRFKRKASLVFHLGKHLEDKRHICKYCGKKYRHKAAWKRHELMHGVSMPRELIEQDNSGSKAREKSVDGVNDNPKDRKCHRQTLKDRLELEKYLESPESHDSSGSRVCKFCGLLFSCNISLGKHLVGHLQNKFHICKRCGKQFKEGRSLQKHLLCHQRRDKNECSDCGREFPSKLALYQHRKQGHPFDKERVLCPICGITFKTKHSLYCHVKTHSDKKLICDICGKSYKQERNLKQHKTLVHINEPVACPICGKKIAKTNLPRHLRIHRGDRPYKCSLCDKAFSQSCKRNAHQQIAHTGQFAHHCSYCKQGFTVPSLLRIHERIHTGEKPFSCSICGKLFRSTTLVKTHEAVAHKCSGSSTSTVKNQFDKYKCSHCDKLFNDSSQFASHVFLSHNKELDRCLLCGDDGDVTFSSSLDLESHMQSAHSNEKPFQCGTCGESFYMFRDYYAHLHLHNDEKCKDCGELFFSKSGLRRHCLLKHSHEPLKKYSCNICGKQYKYNESGNYRRHQRLHSGIKPYKCSVCAAAFAQKVGLETHSWTHRNEKKFQCGKCDRGYNDKRNYIFHVKKSHPEIL